MVRGRQLTSSPVARPGFFVVVVVTASAAATDDYDYDVAFVVFKYNQQDTTLHNVFIAINALHVSDGSSAHHQELKTVHIASGIDKYSMLYVRF